MLTLRVRLLMLWLFTLALCVALGVILYSVYELGTEAQTGRTVNLASNACAALETRYARSVQPAKSSVDPMLMTALLNATLDEAPGVEGGFWHDGNGFVAYAFPTHQGSAPKHDVPTTERDRIEALVRQALGQGKPVVDLLRGSRETVVLTACPVRVADTVFGAWTMARVPLAVGKAYDALTHGLALLLLFAIGSGVWLSYSFFRWTRHFTRIEQALGSPSSRAARLSSAPAMPSSTASSSRSISSAPVWTMRSVRPTSCTPRSSAPSVSGLSDAWPRRWRMK